MVPYVHPKWDSIHQCRVMPLMKQALYPQATTAGLIVISFWLLFLFQVKSLETGLAVNMILLTHYSKPVTCHEWDHWNGFLMHHYAAFSLLLYFLFSAFFCHFSFLLFFFLLWFFLSFFITLSPFSKVW